jgi:hypothetical protein
MLQLQVTILRHLQQRAPAAEPSGAAALRTRDLDTSPVI